MEILYVVQPVDSGKEIYPGSTPLHFAARGGSLDCARELLLWERIGCNQIKWGCCVACFKVSFSIGMLMALKCGMYADHALLLSLQCSTTCQQTKKSHALVPYHNYVYFK